MGVADEIRAAREATSIFRGLFDYVRDQENQLANEGRRSVLGGLLSKEPVAGTDTIRYEGVLPMLANLVEPIARGVDAPRAAAQNLIPQEDMISEAFGTAGTAMLGGGAVAKPADALGANTMRVYHGGPKRLSASEVEMRPDPEGTPIGFSVTDNPDVAEYYRKMRGGGSISEFDIDLNKANIISERELYEFIDDLENKLDADASYEQIQQGLLDAGIDAIEYPDPEFGIRVVNPNILGESLEGFEGYLSRVNPSGKRIAAEDRPNLMMGDMYGMLPRGSDVVGESGDVTFHRSPDGDYYATAYNPDVGEQDVVGYITDRGDSTELQVVAEMQGQGIGGELQYLFRSENPNAPTGGLTEAGERSLERTYDRLFDEGLVSANASKPLGILVLEQQARGDQRLGGLLESLGMDTNDLSTADPLEIQGVLDMAARRGVLDKRSAAGLKRGLLD